MKSKDFSLDPKVVRKIATGMGIPENKEIPGVQAAASEKVRQAFIIDTKNDPTGYLIVIPQSHLKSQSKGRYTLGSESIHSIKHELGHFVEEYQDGKLPDYRNFTPKDRVVSEFNAELRARKGTPTIEFIEGTIYQLVADYGLPANESMYLVRKESLRRGIPRSTISKAESLYRSIWE